jgi:hypothetical protein
MISDTLFSIIAVLIFLKPLTNVLKSGGQVDSEASRRLRRTHRSNVWGVTIAVFSSTLLYINMVLFLAFTFSGDYFFYSSRLLNPWCVGLNLDSILNNVGMVLLCGMLKDVGVRSETSVRNRTNESRGEEI